MWQHVAHVRDEQNVTLARDQRNVAVEYDQQSLFSVGDHDYLTCKYRIESG